MLISNEGAFGMTIISSVSMIAPGASSQIRVHGLNAFQSLESKPAWHLMHIDTLFIHSFSMWIKLQDGSVHTVKVVRLMDYGAIVEFPSGSSSLLHISQLSSTRVSNIEGSFCLFQSCASHCGTLSGTMQARLMACCSQDQCFVFEYLWDTCVEADSRQCKDSRHEACHKSLCCLAQWKASLLCR